MQTILIGTTNAGKVKEFARIFAESGVTVKSLLDFDEVVEVEETGSTFLENAILKAETLSHHYNEAVIADDSGLEIKALDGKPGVYSARYAGPGKNDEENNRKVLAEMQEIPFAERGATFVCVLAFARPGEETVTFTGTCSGYIAEQPLGENGFGYDPIFYIPEKKATMAELSAQEKNALSHRGKALEKLKQFWTSL